MKCPTSRQLVVWDEALRRGLPGTIVHGQLVCGFLGQMLTDWIRGQGLLEKLACTYRRMNQPGNPIVCKGKVLRKYTADHEDCIECSVWAEDSAGERTVEGTAIVTLPARARPEVPRRAVD